MKSDIICVDLFCGCGGLTKGLKDVGISVVKGIDVDITAKNTYEKNNPSSMFVEGDLRHMTADMIMDGIDRRGKSMLLAGCAPCQPFSQHNPNSDGDRRKSLIRCVGAFVEKILPEYVLIENVPAFGNKSNTHHADFIRILKKNGYSFDGGIVNAVDYGVPQKRRRYLLLASRNKAIKIPSGAYGNEERGFRTVRDAIEKFPKIKAGENMPHMKNHIVPKLSKVNLARMRKIPNDGGSRRDLPPHMWLKCHQNHSGHTDTYGRMSWDMPAPTLTCKCTSISNGRFGHPEQNRAISVREAAALQTFPDGYVFCSSATRNAGHIGNAVPVLMASALGDAIVHHAAS